MQLSHVGYQTRGFDVANLYKLFSNLYEVNSVPKMSRFNTYTITTLLHESKGQKRKKNCESFFDIFLAFFAFFFLRIFRQFKKQGIFYKYNEKSQRKIFVLCIFDFMKLH